MKKAGIEWCIDHADNYCKDPDIRKLTLRYAFAGEVLDHMNKKGITCKQLAERTSLSERQLNSIFEGNKNITIDIMCEISMGLWSVVSFNFWDEPIVVSP